MCWRDLEFWPWSDEISRKDREAVTEARRLSRRNRNERCEAGMAPLTVDRNHLAAAVTAALARAGCVDELNRQFAAGESVKCVGAWRADRVVLELPPQANDAAASLEGRGDVARASNRAAGRCFAAWKAEMRRQ